MKSIIFNTEEIQAILDGRKGQFRLSIKNNIILEDWIMQREAFRITHSKYKVEDILYVKEKCVEEYPFGYCFKENYKIEEWTDKNLTKKYCNELNARVFLKVTNARVERLQDIQILDFFGEGFRTRLTAPYMEGRGWFSAIWNKKAKDGYKWEDNPYVFVYEFERVER